MFLNNKSLKFVCAAVLSAGLLVSCSEQDLANIKLTEHLKKYDQAAQIIIERNYKSDNPIARDEWEALFIVDEADEFNDIEIGLIKENQKLIIEQNRQAAIRKSAIDLDPLRNNETALGEFCHLIPKGGMLHVHP
ncbi:MAG: hypothetical protein HOM01_11900, partial [Kordiimonadaceae bacterium]|nr:hypothetical protein [Kordiimonadaceae bacterium]